MRRYENHYKCNECETEVHPASYRARCPDCGGTLRAGPDSDGAARN